MRQYSKPMTRRRFLYLTGAMMAGAGISACGRATPTMPTPAPTDPPVPTEPPAAPTLPPQPSATAAPAGTARLHGGSADVWAWDTLVTGEVEGGSCGELRVQANGQDLTVETDGSRFQAHLRVQPGENRVSAACQPGETGADEVVLTGRLRSAPVSTIDIRIEDGKLQLDGSASQMAPVDPAPIAGYRWVGEGLLDGQPETPAIEVTPPAEDGAYFLALEVTDEAGRTDISRTYFVVENGQPRLPDWTWENAPWIDDAVVYGVIPRKFGSDGFNSITARLDALQELGINALWLAPVNSSPPGDYGYAVTDYFALRDRLGTEDDFRQMVQAAHQRGIRVLMDFVPNHSSAEHPYFKEAQAKGPESRYWNFYDRDANGSPTHYFSWEHLPNLNYDNPDVANWMTEAFAYWVREFDVDGFRVDVAWGIRERNPEYWPRWRAALKRIKPDVLLLAEASARDEYYFTEGFDAAYDWTDQLGHWAWEQAFDDPTLLLYNLNNALTNGRSGFHEDALIFRFLNNNDTGGRFITHHGEAMTRVATTMLLTLPGIPCIYTGDEIGASYTPYGDPLPLNWDDDPLGMFAFHKQLIHLRHDVPALHSRHWQHLRVEPRPQVLGYVRYTAPESDPALVLLNFSKEPASVQPNLPDPFAAVLQAGPLTDLLTGSAFSLAGGGTVAMEPQSALILTKA